VSHALGFAGAKLQGIVDTGSGRYRVSYVFRESVESVTVDDTLRVLDAGICLSGRERDFDLSSIVWVKHRRWGDEGEDE